MLKFGGGMTHKIELEHWQTFMGGAGVFACPQDDVPALVLS